MAGTQVGAYPELSWSPDKVKQQANIQAQSLFSANSQSGLQEQSPSQRLNICNTM